jgi:hypothetical protein
MLSVRALSVVTRCLLSGTKFGLTNDLSSELSSMSQFHWRPALDCCGAHGFAKLNRFPWPCFLRSILTEYPDIPNSMRQLACRFWHPTCREIANIYVRSHVRAHRTQTP